MTNGLALFLLACIWTAVIVGAVIVMVRLEPDDPTDEEPWL